MATQQINIRTDINEERFNSHGQIWPPDHIIRLNKCLREEVTID